jgi:hypothetical protein
MSRTVEKAISYLRCCECAIDEPELYEAVGAYIADDVVPAALHAEVLHSLILTYRPYFVDALPRLHEN